MHQFSTCKLYFQKSGLEQTLVLSSLFSVALTFTRVGYTGEQLFLFLIWNLFLAFVPLAITHFLQRYIRWIESTPLFVIGFVAWLLFLPNSFYIITDLFHLEERRGIPLWFDLTLIFSFAWNGLIMGVVSVRQMEKLVAVKWPIISEWLFMLPLMFLNALGIYIGRYLRYNSWDVISKPFDLTKDILYLALHPVRNRFDWSMIICFTVLMTTIYLSIKKLSKA
ncbi:MAG: DUF1361 domain-containing protein [Chitinophagaceae bacterium]